METRPRIVLTHWVHEEVIELLRPHGEVVPNPSRETLSRAEFLRRSRDAEALLVFMPDRVDEALLAQCPRLRIVAGAFKGADNVDVVACSRRGVWVTVVPDLLTGPTAELAVGLLLALIRKILPGDALVRGGDFQGWRPVLYGGTLQGKQVGVFGMGAVGQAIARRLRGFEARLLYADLRRLEPDREAELALQFVTFDALLGECDHLILAAPLTSETFHRVSRGTLSRIRPGTTLVNVGRGSVVDEEAVAEAIRAGRLAGYAADVFEREDQSRPDRPRDI
ncbi:MAG TPA: NAD(P)-dependent oxidoreductase, partial [Planctomycetota bacterium]|nr:NAD(P)-dependent oxidoreductase [Planctomycetota bacterium]